MMLSFIVAITTALAVRGDVTTFGSGTNEFVMDFSTIVAAGNVAQSGENRDHSRSGGDGLGAVSYEYKISTYQVAIDQFTKAQAASGNTIGDGDENYWTSLVGSNAPATKVSWYEAAKFCNWLTSGSATDGAYQFDVNGTFVGINRHAAVSKYGVVYVLPDVNEWFKAAYYNTASQKYTLYAFGVNTEPELDVDANFYGGAVNRPWVVGAGNLEQNGTYDMMGNVWEWTEEPVSALRRVRGGGYHVDATAYAASDTSYRFDPTYESYQVGFRVAAIPVPSRAGWNSFLYPSEYLDGESHCPTNYLKIFVATNGYNTSANVNNSNTPIKTLYFARYLISAIEAYDKVHGLNRYPGYCVLLKRGETFVPYDYFALQSSQLECVSDEYNRAAFYWNINKPLFITSYGSSGDRPIIDGQTGYINKVNSYGETNSTVRVQFPFMICIPPEIATNGASWNQNTVIENLHIRNWELSAIWNYKNINCKIQNNIIEKIGTYYFPDEEYLLAGTGQKVDGGPAVDRWPIYAGAAIYAHRANNVNVHNNALMDIHNLDKNDYPLVDKLHAIYIMAAINMQFQSNCIQRISGPPLTIKFNASNVQMTDNWLENAAPVTNVTQYWSGTYVQQGFVRIPATYGLIPTNVTITGNTFLFPFFWDIELGRKTNCSGQAAMEFSGDFFDNPTNLITNLIMTNNLSILEWDPSWY